MQDLAIGEANSVSIALVVTELLTNANKHKSHGSILLKPSRSPKSAKIEVRNQGRLSGKFEWTEGKGLGSGLSLVRSLLPSKGVQLSIEQTGGEVAACLTLEIPRAVFPTGAAAEHAR